MNRHHSQRSILLSFGLSAVVLGCAELYGDAGKQFSKGTEGVTTIVSSSIAPSVRVERIRLVDSRWLKSGLPPSQRTIDFSEFACAGVGIHWREAAAVKGLKVYGDQVGDMVKKPDQDIGALWKEITKDDPEALEQPKRGLDQMVDCEQRVEALFHLDPNLMGAEAGPLALAAIPELIAAAEKAAVGVLSLAAEAKRGARISKYVRESRATVELLITHLEHPHGGLQSVCAAPDTKILCASLKGRTPTTIDAMHVRRQWAALRLPKYRFDVLSRSVPSAPGETAKRDVLAEALQIHGDLSDFDEARAIPEPAKAVDELKKAQADLERLANGRLKKGEYLKLATAFAKNVKDISAGVKDAQKTLASESDSAE